MKFITTRISVLFCMVLTGISLQAQPVISNAEDFSIGTVLKFQKCEPDGIMPGSDGSDQVWNFSNLVTLPDTTIETLVNPASTPSGTDFPEANLAESYSDGRFVYVDKQSDGNYLVGFADPNSGLIMHYANSMRFAVRPITFGTIVSDDFTNTYSVNSLNFTGAGTVDIHADGYGTLILPNGTYENVLRLKIEQSRIDTLIEYQTTSATYTVTYAWFDGIHASSLLKIDSTYSAGFMDKSVEYLLDETTTGLQNSPERFVFNFFPNPAINQITLKTADRGVLSILDINGKTLIIRKIEAGINQINIELLPAGQYILNYETGENLISRKLIVAND